MKIAHALDDFGIDYIEAGWPGSNPIDDKFYADPPKLVKSRLCAFGMTRRSKVSTENDPGLNALIASKAGAVCIVGKSWMFHLKNALNITAEENLRLISDSIAALAKNNKEVLFDAEHFFDGYKDDPKFALEVIKTAKKSGARWVVLCDTNGGTLPSEISKIVGQVTDHIKGENLGIHCHNDTENAVANSLAAVEAGVRQIQGTINGIGERCGNANLVSIIPTLVFKMNCDIGIESKKLEGLVKFSNYVNEIVGKERNKFAAYVGEHAFSHKGGLHVSAVSKNAVSYEHIDPESVGNKRQIMISDQSGRANIISRLKEIGLNPEDHIKFSQIADLVNQVKELEAVGYAYDSADASFELLAKRHLSSVPVFFELLSYRAVDENKFGPKGKSKVVSEVTVKIRVGKKIAMAVAEGNGPVNALDKALRKVLSRKYPVLKSVKLVDYKVRILTPSDGTEAITRVQIESADDKGHRWSVIGVSPNIVDASYRALYDSITFKLMKEQEKKHV